jgi:hypothetical protein
MHHIPQMSYHHTKGQFFPVQLAFPGMKNIELVNNAA